MPRKKPAFERPGRYGERRVYKPGTKIGETRNGSKQMQRSRASQERLWARNRAANRMPTATPLPLAKSRRGRPFRATTPRLARPGKEHTGYSRDYGRRV